MSFDSVAAATKALYEYVSAHTILMLFVFPFAAAGALGLTAKIVKSGGKLSNREIVDHFFPIAHWISASTKVDLAIYLIQKFTRPWIGVFASVLTVYVASLTAGVFMGEIKPPHEAKTSFDVIVVGLAMFMFADLGTYLSHYLQHKIPILWEFHKVHHSASFLTPFTTHRFHPVDDLMDAFFSGIFLVIPVTLGRIYCGFTFEELMVLSSATYIFSTLFLLGGLQHSHFPIKFGVLEWIFISPSMHQIHHSARPEHWNKNMGSQLAIWDLMLGTRVVLSKGETLRFGLGAADSGSEDYNRVWRCYAGPLSRAYHLARTSPSRATRFMARKRDPEAVVALSTSMSQSASEG